MSVKIKSFIMEGGERASLLINNTSGLPVIHENLYVMIHLRNQNRSISTIRACLRDLVFFRDVCTLLKLDSNETFRSGNTLSYDEILNIVDLCKCKKSYVINGALKVKSTNVVLINPKRKESSRHTIRSEIDSIKEGTFYNRLSNIISYCEWLATYLMPDDDKNKKSEMIALLKQFRPSDRFTESNSKFKSLTDRQIKKVNEVVRFDSKENPWQSESVRFRNMLIVDLLALDGSRRSELLNITMDDIDFTNEQLCIRRNANALNDSRIYQPLVKTLGRNIAHSEESLKMVEDYIIYHRPKNAKTPYLIVSHGRGKNNGSPLSLRRLNSIFEDISNVVGFKVTPHMLRHTWNDDFSSNAESLLESGEMTEKEVEDARSYHMGWKEGSGTARTYTKRYNEKKAMKLALDMQKKNLKRTNQIKLSENTEGKLNAG
jgi:integrase